MKKKIVAIILVAAVAIGGGVFSYFHFFNANKTLQAIDPIHGIRGIVDEEDVGHISLRNGEEVIEVMNAKSVWLTPDKKKIVVLDTSDNLYWTNPDQKKKELIANEVDQIYDVGNKTVFYYKDNDMVGATYSSDDGIVLDGYGYTYSAVNQNGYMVNRNDNGSTLYTYNSDSDEFEVLAKSDDDIRVIYQNAPTDYFLWAEQDDDYYQVKMTNDGEDTDLFEIYVGDDLKAQSISSQLVGGSPYGFYRVFYDGMYSSMTDDYSREEKEVLNTIYYYDDNKEDTAIELNGICFIVYTKNGYIGYEDSLADEYYAITIDADDYKKYIGSLYSYDEDDDESKDEEGFINLEYIDEYGDSEVLLEDLKQCYVSNGYVYFVDEDDVLVEAELDGDSIKKAKKIDEDVTYLNDSGLNGYVYYFKNKGDDGLSDLYTYKHGNKPERIEKNVRPLNDYASYNYDGDMSTRTNPTGDTVYFYRDVEQIGDENEYMGELCKYTYGEDIEEIDDNVFIYYTFSPNYASDCTKDFTYLVVKSNHEGYANVCYCYYDGEESYVLDKDFEIRV